MNLSQTQTYRDLRAVLIRLELVSHAPTQNLQPAESDPARRLRLDTDEPAGISRLSEKGGRRPPGGLDDDRLRRVDEMGDPDLVMLRSADHFKRRAEGCNTEHDLALVLRDAREALRSYLHAPEVTDPPFGSFEFKMQVVRAVEGGLSPDAAKQRFGIGRSTVYKYLAQFSEDDSWRRGRGKAA